MLKKNVTQNLPDISGIDYRDLEILEENDEREYFDPTVDPFALIKTQKTLDEILNYTVDEQISFENNLLDDCGFKIESILNSNRDHLVIGPMGSGKTYAFIKTALDNRTKVIFLVPLRVNDQQLSKEHSLKSLKDLKNVKKIKKTLASETLMICVYDSLPKIYDALIELDDLHNWIVIVDEVHNFISQADFRYMALRKMRNMLPGFKNRIYLTGTAEGLIPCLRTYSKELYVNYFYKNNPVVSNGKLTLFPTSDTATKFLLHHLVKNQVEGLTVIAIDSITIVKSVANKIKRFLGTNKVQALSSKEKKGKTYAEIINNQSIKKDIKYLVTTSVISDGCNIKNKNISAIYSVNWKDLNKLRQLHSRFREADDTVKYYDVFKFKESTIKGPLVDIDESFRKRKEHLENLAHNLSDGLLRKSSKDYEHHHSGNYFYYVNNIVLLDQFLVQYLILKGLFYQLNNPDERLKYYSCYSNFSEEDISIESVTLNTDEDKIINAIIDTDIKKRFISTLYKYADNLPDIIKKINDKRRKIDVKPGTKTKSTAQVKIENLIGDPLALELLNEFISLYNIIQNPAICIRLISYDKKLLKAVKEWIRMMSIYYEIKLTNKKKFGNNDQLVANTISHINRSISSDNELNPKELSKKLKITEYKLKKYISSIFNFIEKPKIKRNKRLINFSERSLNDLLPENKLFLNYENPIDTPGNDMIFNSQKSLIRKLALVKSKSRNVKK